MDTAVLAEEPAANQAANQATNQVAHPAADQATYQAVHPATYQAVYLADNDKDDFLQKISGSALANWLGATDSL